MANIQNLPDLRPSLLLDFANSRQVDPRVTFARASTAMRWNAAGMLETVPAGVPRIDHDPATGKCLGLLVEGARTNLRTDSRQPTAATGAVLGASTAIAPDGLAVTSIEDNPATSGEHYTNDASIAVTAGQTIIQSIFAKAMPGAERQVALRVAGGSAGNQVLAFNVSDTACSAAVVSGYSYGIQKCLNGWWRIWISYTAASDVPAAIFRVQLYKNNASVYQGEAGKGLFLFGRQVEVGDSVSSYIPAGASVATRAAEIAPLDLPAYSDITVLTEYQHGAKLRNTRALGLYAASATASNIAVIAANLASTSSAGVVASPAGPNSTVPGLAPVAGRVDRVAFARRASGAMLLAARGSPLGAGNHTGVTAPMQTICLGNSTAAGTVHLDGYIRRVAVWFRALTQTELNKITEV